MKWKRLDIPMYRIEVFFCIEKDGNKVHNKVSSLGFSIRETDEGDINPIKNAGCVIPIFDSVNVRSYLLWLPTFKMDKDNLDTLVHEITHLKNYIFKHIGVQGLPPEYDELEAYLMGYLAGEFFKFWRK